MYLTYEEYASYGGTMPEADFALAEFRARKRIDWLTDNRVRAACQRISDSGQAVIAEGENSPGNSEGLDGATRAREEVPEAVKLAMMAIIRADSAVGVDVQAGAPLVASFSTDGYSENYGSAADQTRHLEAQLNAEVRRLLYGVKGGDGVPLLYRGVM